MAIPNLQATPTFSGTAPTNVTITAFSPDGMYLALGRSTQPFLKIYKRNVSTDVFTELTYNGTWTSTFAIRGMVWHSDSRVITTVDTGNNFQAFYINASETWWYYTASSPTNGNYFNPNPCTDLAISPNGTQIAGAVSGSNGKMVFVTSWNAATYQYTSQSVTASFTGDVVGARVKFLSETRIAVVCYNSVGTDAYLQTVSWNGSTWVLDGNVVTIAIAAVISAAFSQDGKYVAFGTGTGEFMRVYKYNSAANNFSKLSAPATGASSAVYAVCFNRDGSAIIAGDASSPRLEFYSLFSDVLTKSSAVVAVDASATPLWIDRTRDGLLYAVALGSTGVKLYADPSAGNGGDLLLPGFTMAGTGDLSTSPKAANGNWAFPALTMEVVAAASAKEVYPGGLRAYSGTAVVSITGDGAGSAAEVPPPFMYADWSFPSFTMTGAVERTLRVESGDILFPGFTMGGLVGWPGAGTGVWSFPGFTAAGTGTVPTGAGAGAWSFPGFAAAGTVALDPGFGAIWENAPFPSFTMEGMVNAPMGLAGDIAFPGFTASGTVNLLYSANGEWGFPAFQFEGRGPDPIHGDGDMLFPGFAVSAEVGMPIWSVSEVTFPTFGLEADVAMPTGVVGDWGLPSLTMAGSLARTNHIDALWGFPGLTLEGLGGPTARANGIAPFPMFTLSGPLTLSNPLEGDILFPAFSMEGRGRPGPDGGAAVAFGYKGTFSIGGGISFFFIDTIKIG